jgi:hypothetical protein
MLTITSLTHPTMIAKIRKGITLAAKGKGHEMGGHANRVYIQNRKGHNILRIDWKGQGKFIAYGGADWGRTDITEIVKEALQRGCSANRVKPRQFGSSPSIKDKLAKALALSTLGVLITGCQASGGMTTLVTVLSGWL